MTKRGLSRRDVLGTLTTTAAVATAGCGLLNGGGGDGNGNTSGNQTMQQTPTPTPLPPKEIRDDTGAFDRVTVNGTGLQVHSVRGDVAKVQVEYNGSIVGTGEANESQITSVPLIRYTSDKAHTLIALDSEGEEIARQPVVLNPEISLSVVRPSEAGITATDAKIAYKMTNSGTGPTAVQQILYAVPDGEDYTLPADAGLAATTTADNIVPIPPEETIIVVPPRPPLAPDSPGSYPSCGSTIDIRAIVSLIHTVKARRITVESSGSADTLAAADCTVTLSAEAERPPETTSGQN